MGNIIGQMANAVTGGLLQTGLDLAFGGMQDRRQMRQQKKMQALEIKGQKEMGKFNQELAYDMWQKTNYEAQRKHMENAGLNVGLMYEGGGPGGTTSTPTGNVTGGHADARSSEAGMGMQLGMQMAMQKAQIDNMAADTEKKKAEAEKLAGVDTAQAQTTIQKMLQDTANAAIQGELMRWDTRLKEIEANVANENQHEIINQAKFATSKLIGEAREALAKGQVSEETINTQIQQIRTAAIEQTLRISAQKQGLITQKLGGIETAQRITNLGAELTNMIEQRKIDWAKIDQNEKERLTKEMLGKAQLEFETSTPQHVKQWTSIFTDILRSFAD